MEPAVSTEPPAGAGPSLFRDLVTSPTILSAIEKLGFEAATPVQARTVPAAAAGRDLIVQARTGSGKTLAYVIPLLQLLERISDTRSTIGLIVAPTRELAVQITEVIANVGGIKVPCLIGGASIADQRRDLDRERRIIVGTPGRLLDFLRNRDLMLRKCQYYVLDEADEMLSMDFLEDVEEILARLPAEKQGLFISATITPRVEMLASRFLRTPERIIVETPAEALPSIEHRYYEILGDITAKATLLCDLLDTARPRSAIIFCNTRSDTELVEVFLRRRGFDARRINSDLTQKQRDAVMTMIRSGRLRFLVGTDIAARGLDIEQIDAVINYTLPEQPEVYIHRTGRTGRAGRSGVAMSLIGPTDFAAFQLLKRSAPVPLQKMELPTEEEVQAARIAHIAELLNQADIGVQPRDTALARGILEQVGKVQNPSEELVAMFARLTRLGVEHLLGTKTRSLEEEIDAGGDRASEPPREPRRDDGGYGRGGGRDRGGRDRGGRGGGRDRGGRGGGGRGRR